MNNCYKLLRFQNHKTKQNTIKIYRGTDKDRLNKYYEKNVWVAKQNRPSNQIYSWNKTWHPFEIIIKFHKTILLFNVVRLIYLTDFKNNISILYIAFVC